SQTISVRKQTATSTAVTAPEGDYNTKTCVPTFIRSYRAMTCLRMRMQSDETLLPLTAARSGPGNGATGNTSHVDAMSTYFGRRIAIKQISASDAQPAVSANAAGSDVCSTANAIIKGAADCMSRNGPASRPIRRP